MDYNEFNSKLNKLTNPNDLKVLFDRLKADGASLRLLGLVSARYRTLTTK